MRTALITTALGAAAIALIPAAASAQQYRSAYGAYPQGNAQYDCDDSTPERAVVGGLLGAVAGAAIGASSNDHDNRYRGHRGYSRGYGRGYSRSSYGHRGYRGHDRNNGDDTAAGAIIGGLLGAAVGAATGEKKCAPVYRNSQYNTGYYNGRAPYPPSRARYEQRGYYGDARHDARYYNDGYDPRYDQRHNQRYDARYDPRGGASYDPRYDGQPYGYQQAQPQYAPQPQYVQAQPQAQIYTAQSSSYGGARNYADVLAGQQGGYVSGSYSSQTPDARLLGGN